MPGYTVATTDHSDINVKVTAVNVTLLRTHLVGVHPAILLLLLLLLLVAMLLPYALVVGVMVLMPKLARVLLAQLPLPLLLLLLLLLMLLHEKVCGIHPAAICHHCCCCRRRH